MSVYWDACVFLSYVNNDADRVPSIEEMIARTRKKELQILTSTVTIVEVARGAAEQAGSALDAAVDEAIASLWDPGSGVMLVEFYPLIAHAARDLMRSVLSRGWSLKPMDAIHLATAQHWHVDEFHTYDGGLSKYEELLPFKICEPSVAEQQLPGM